MRAPSRRSRPPTRPAWIWLAVLVVGLQMVAGPPRAVAQRALGIDVYSGHGYITWTSVKSAGYTWAWAKATEGTGYQDAQFVNNMNNARAAGVLIGPYHYARYDLGTSGAGEATWFWQVVSPYLKTDGTCIMPMLDVEATTTLSQAQVSAWVVDFCQTFIAEAAAAGITARMLIYTYPWYADTYLDTSVTHTYLLDMADLNGEDPQTGSPYLSTWPTWTTWQYSWTIRVPGVPGDANGYCLMDVFNGTLDTLKTTLVIGCPPTVISSQPVGTTNCQGTTASFSVVAGPAPLSYQWQKNGNNLGGATASSLTLGGVTTNDAATYSVKISNNCGSTNSTPATLTVGVPPGISGQPVGQTVCQGGSVTLTVSATGTAPSYQWRSNGTNLSGTLSSYTLSNVHTNKSGDYSVIVSNSCGVVTSSVATLIVTVPPAIAIQPQSQVFTQGGNVTFAVTPGAGSSPSYHWQFNGNNLSGTLSSYSLGNVHANKAGAYTVVLSNNCNTLTSAVAWLTIAMPLASQTAYQGAAASFMVTNVGADPSLTCQWQRNGTNLTDGVRVSGSGTTNLSLSGITTNDAGSYSVVVGNGAGSATTVGATLAVLVPPPPHFDSIGLLPDGSVGLSISGTPGVSYTLQCTSNWVDWASLTNFSSSSGLFPYNDPAATQADQRFYRVRPGP